MAAHAAFDPVWKSGAKKRGSAYAWLADELGMGKKDCHIGMMDVADCRRVVDACKGHNVVIQGLARSDSPAGMESSTPGNEDERNGL
jgi:hypothetical protein